MTKKVERYECTGGGCPMAWEGATEDGTRFYIRYRHGWLTVRMHGSQTVLEKDIGSGADGVMSDEEMFGWVSGVLDFGRFA